MKIRSFILTVNYSVDAISDKDESIVNYLVRLLTILRRIWVPSR